MSGLSTLRLERKRKARPGQALTPRQVAAEMRKLADPDGGDPGKILARLRNAGFELTYVQGHDPVSKAFRTAAQAKRWARSLRKPNPTPSRRPRAGQVERKVTRR